MHEPWRCPSPGNGACRASAISPSGPGSQSEAERRRAGGPAAVDGHLHQPGPEAAGAGGGGRHPAPDRVREGEGEVGGVGPGAGPAGELHEDPAPLAHPGDEPPGVAGPHRVLVADQHHVEGLGHRGDDRAPLAPGRSVHHHHPLEVDAQLGRGEQPDLRGADPDHPRPGGRRTGHQPEGERRRARALHRHHRAPLEAAPGRQPGQRRGEGQQVLTGQRGRADPPAEDLQLAHPPSIEHLFGAGKRTYRRLGDASSDGSAVAAAAFGRPRVGSSPATGSR